MSRSISFPDSGFDTLQNLWQATSLKEAAKETLKWTSYGATATGALIASEWLVSKPLSLEAITPIVLSSALIGTSIPLTKWSLSKINECRKNILRLPSETAIPLILVTTTLGIKILMPLTALATTAFGTLMPLTNCLSEHHCVQENEWDSVNSGVTALVGGVVFPLIGAHLKDVGEMTFNLLRGKKLNASGNGP